MEAKGFAMNRPIKPPRFGIGDRIIVDWVTEDGQRLIDCGEVIAVCNGENPYVVGNKGYTYLVRYDYLPASQKLCPYIDWAFEDEMQLDKTVHVWLHALGFVRNSLRAVTPQSSQDSWNTGPQGGYAAKGLDGS